MHAILRCPFRCIFAQYFSLRVPLTISLGCLLWVATHVGQQLGLVGYWDLYWESCSQMAQWWPAQRDID